MPFRSYDRAVLRTEPLIYRLEEAVLHYGMGKNIVIYLISYFIFIYYFILIYLFINKFMYP